MPLDTVAKGMAGGPWIRFHERFATLSPLHESKPGMTRPARRGLQVGLALRAPPGPTQATPCPDPCMTHRPQFRSMMDAATLAAAKHAAGLDVSALGRVHRPDRSERFPQDDGAVYLGQTPDCAPRSRRGRKPMNASASKRLQSVCNAQGGTDEAG